MTARVLRKLSSKDVRHLPGSRRAEVCAVAGDSSKLLTGSGDSSAKLWDMETGKDLFSFKFHEPCRAVAFSLGDGMAAISSDPFIGAPAAIHLVTIAGAACVARHALPSSASALDGSVGGLCAVAAGEACPCMKLSKIEPSYIYLGRPLVHFGENCVTVIPSILSKANASQLHVKQQHFGAGKAGVSEQR